MESEGWGIPSAHESLPVVAFKWEMPERVKETEASTQETPLESNSVGGWHSRQVF